MTPFRPPTAHVLSTRTLVWVLLAIVGTRTAAAQESWPRTHQPATWYTITVDRPITDRVALVADGNWRRMGFVEEPQQVLLRSGLMVRVVPGLRVGGGYAYVATAPYGELPTTTPFREHRLWQQAVLTHAVGPVALTHRYRWEQRWIAPVVDGTTGDYGYQQRARYMVRAQTPVARRVSAAPIQGYVQEELLMPVGHNGASGRLTQNRFLVGLGLPVTPGQRLDVGYMNLWNALPSKSANEVNHTLVLNWVITGR